LYWLFCQLEKESKMKNTLIFMHYVILAIAMVLVGFIAIALMFGPPVGNASGYPVNGYPVESGYPIEEPANEEPTIEASRPIEEAVNAPQETAGTKDEGASEPVRYIAIFTEPPDRLPELH
jgi:hypothetical protein